MQIGEKLRELREAKNFSQGDIEQRTGMLRCYVSRVENSHTVPAVETLEKFARALELPMYRLFYEGAEPPKKLPRAESVEPLWGTNAKERPELRRLAKALSHMNGRKRTLLLGLGQRMEKRNQTLR
jgi:transcriptional regulator with XRE-family HTH domain